MGIKPGVQDVIGNTSQLMCKVRRQQDTGNYVRMRDIQTMYLNNPRSESQNILIETVLQRRDMRGRRTKGVGGHRTWH